MSSLVSVRDLADRGDVAWKYGAKVDGESGMERDSSGEVRAFRGVKIGACHEHSEPVDCNARGNANG